MPYASAGRAPGRGIEPLRRTAPAAARSAGFDDFDSAQRGGVLPRQPATTARLAPNPVESIGSTAHSRFASELDLKNPRLGKRRSIHDPDLIELTKRQACLRGPTLFFDILLGHSATSTYPGEVSKRCNRRLTPSLGESMAIRSEGLREAASHPSTLLWRILLSAHGPSVCGLRSLLHTGAPSHP